MDINRSTNQPSNNYGDMVTFRYFTMAASRHLEFSNSKNLNGRWVAEVADASVAKFHQNRSSGCEDITISPVFKDGGRPLSWLVFHVTGPPTRIFGGLYCYAKFGWNPCSSFHNMNVWIFCKFCLNMPIHAPKNYGFGERYINKTRRSTSFCGKMS